MTVRHPCGWEIVLTDEPSRSDFQTFPAMRAHFKTCAAKWPCGEAEA